MAPTKSLLLSAALAAMTAVPALAQHSQLGLHGGYNTDRSNFLVGAQAVIPVSASVDVYPSLDYHFLSSGNQVGVNLDLRLRNPYGASSFYAGGGLALMRTSISGNANTDTGADILAGWMNNTGVVHPYAEVRGLLNRNSSVQLVAGINWTLY